MLATTAWLASLLDPRVDAYGEMRGFTVSPRFGEEVLSSQHSRELCPAASAEGLYEPVLCAALARRANSVPTVLSLLQHLRWHRVIHNFGRGPGGGYGLGLGGDVAEPVCCPDPGLRGPGGLIGRRPEQ